MKPSLRARALPQISKPVDDLSQPGDAIHWVAAPPVLHEVRPPSRLPDDPFRLDRGMRIAVPPLRIARFRDGFLSAEGTAFSPDGRDLLFEEAVMWPMRVNGQPFGQPAGHSWWRDRPETSGAVIDPAAAEDLPGACLALGAGLGDLCSNWHHWLVELLPRLSVAGSVRECADLPVVLPRPRTAAQFDSLAAAGVDRSRVVVSQAPTLRPETAYLVMPTGNPAFQSNRALDRLVETILGNLGMGDGQEGRGLIFVRRAKTGRQLLNEADCLARLAPLGFTGVLNEDLGFAEQVATYRGARCVIAVHGAGLANTIFCRPGTLVIEIYPRVRGDIISGTCSSLSYARRLPHLVLGTDETRPDGASRLDPDRLLWMVVKALSGEWPFVPVPFGPEGSWGLA